MEGVTRRECRTDGPGVRGCRKLDGMGRRDLRTSSGRCVYM